MSSPHLDESGRARMVDVGGKSPSARAARAACRLEVSPETARLIEAGDLPKGDAITVARIAGIQAAKRTDELIPMCHTIALDDVEVTIDVDASAGIVEIGSVVSANDRTGVEMEALLAASVAALTLYDMVKGVERGAVVTDVRLLEKSGGTRGDWSRSD